MTGLAIDEQPTTKMPSVTLRRPTMDDCELVYQWNLAPDVRAPASQPPPVSFADHARWFAQRIPDGGDPIWIIETLAGPVGVVRLDAIGGGLTRIAIAIAAGERGHGIGRRAIVAVCRRWGKPIIAEIFADNLASRACFEACGFCSVVECDGLHTYHWDPET